MITDKYLLIMNFNLKPKQHNKFNVYTVYNKADFKETNIIFSAINLNQ